MTRNRRSDNILSREGVFILEKIVSEELMAFLPVYIELKGNCTSIHTMVGGNYYVEKSLKTFLNQLAEYYIVDLKAVRKYYGELLFVKNLVPIPLNQENVFIPLKIRKPICKNDGSTGYINIKYIEKATEFKGKTIIHLKNKTTIDTLNTIDTVNKHIKNGYMVKRLYNERNNSNRINEYDFFTEYNKPATKGDIALILSQIEKVFGQD